MNVKKNVLLSLMSSCISGLSEVAYTGSANDGYNFPDSLSVYAGENGKKCKNLYQNGKPLYNYYIHFQTKKVECMAERAYEILIMV